MDHKRQLIFGIMCEGDHLSQWQAQCIKELVRDSNIRLALIIRDGGAFQSSVWAKLKRVKVKRILYLLYIRFLFRPACNQLVDMSEYYRGVPAITCQVRHKGKFSQYFKKEDVDAIKSKKLDFILRFGFNIIRGDVLQAAKYGVWSFHHDDETKYRGGPPAFWEIYNNDPVTGAILQRLTNRLDGGVILKKGYFKTCLYSYQKNMNEVYFGATQWPWLVCKDILSNSADYLEEEATKSNAPIYYPPINRQFLKFVIKDALNKVKRLIHHLFFREYWNVGIIEEPIQNFIKENYKPTVHFLSTPPANEFYADPFGYEHAGANYVLLEKFDFKKNIGKIDVWKQNGVSIWDQRDIFKVDCHQSYPYIFSDQDDLYCLPEMSEAQKLILYKLQGSEWLEQSTLLEGIPCVDATLIKYENKYWLFFTRTDQNSDVNLYIKYAPVLQGPWIDHPANPVKMDIRSSRPAGSFFWHENKLYRPAQNCSKTYGGSVVINKVVVLNEKKYHEEAVREVFPWNQYYKDGIHTLSVLGNRTLIDGKRKNFIGSSFSRKLTLRNNS